MLTERAMPEENGTLEDAPRCKRRWLGSIRIYLAVTAIGHLVWEFAHMPLYTIYASGTTREIVFAGLHCTAGDILIATAVLVVALIGFGESDWPATGAARIFAATLALGIGYTIFSEWLNISVKASWAYSEWMPVVPIIGAGLSPLLQWIVVPSLAYGLAVGARGRSARNTTL